MNRILVTGSTSLIGREFIKYCLANEGYNLALITNPSSTRNNKLPKFDVSIIECDLIDSKRLTKVLEAVTPDVIVHIAQMKFSNKVVESMLSAGLDSWLIVVGSTKIYSKLASVSLIF